MKLDSIELIKMKIDKIIIPILFFLSFSAFAQNIEKSNKYLLLRGKISSFFVHEDAFWRNANIGVEFRALNQHSIGIDYVYFRWRYENDSIVNGIEYSNGFNAYSRRDYINIDYRFYPFKNLMKQKGFDPYFNSFVKIGKRKVWSEDPTARVIEAPFKPIIAQNSNYSDLGFAIGMRRGGNKFGIDINLGVVKRISDIWYEQGYDYSTNSYFERYNIRETKWVFHMRLNLYAKIFNF